MQKAHTHTADGAGHSATDRSNEAGEGEAGAQTAAKPFIWDFHDTHLSLRAEWPWVFCTHIAPSPLNSEMRLSIITRLEKLSRCLL